MRLIISTIKRFDPKAKSSLKLDFENISFGLQELALHYNNDDKNDNDNACIAKLQTPKPL